MKKNKLLQYNYHIAIDHRLFAPKAAVLVSVSGGVDSMTLLWICTELLKLGLLSRVRVLHFNHGTRQENHLEQQMVENFCQQLGVACQTVHLQMNFKSNFEAEAREARHAQYLQFLTANETLLQAHHLDDSFEWSLMSRFKSGVLKSALGIPAKNGRISRPLMCLSKKQILAIAKRFNIAYANDSSNEQTRFERNYVRKEIVPLIAARFPQYLSHYVAQANLQARLLGLHLLVSQGACAKQDSFGGIWVFQRSLTADLRGLEEEMEKAIRSISTVHRGSLRQQIARGIAAAANYKVGPLLFSGEVLGFFYPGAAYFIARSGLSSWNQYDLSLYERWQNNKDSQIPSLDIKTFETILQSRIGDKDRTFPHLIIATGHALPWPSLKKVDPLLPKTTSLLIEKGLYFRHALHFLALWQKRSRFCFAIRDI